MKINFFFTGKLRKGPELELFEKYRFRFDKLGRNLHLGPVTVFEEDIKKNAKTFKKQGPSKCVALLMLSFL